MSPRSTAPSGGRHPRTPQRTVFQRAQRALGCSACSLIAFAAGPAAATPSVDIVMTDHHFRLSAPIEGGALDWHVKNEGTEPHQALVIRLPEGVSEYGEQAWFEHGSKGPEPGERIGGVEKLEPGAAASFTTNLKPGKYLLLCAMSENEGRHYALGMIYRFEIP